MIEKVRMWLPITKMKKTSWPNPRTRRPAFPKRRSPASAIEWISGCWVLSCPIVYPVYEEMDPIRRMVKMPLEGRSGQVRSAKPQGRAG
jgi:hypothetical protein